MLKLAIRFLYPTVRHISTADLSTWIAQSPPSLPVLLDTRTAAEYAISHLPHSQHLDPKTADFAQLHLAKNTPIVVYCSVGMRSGAIAQRLQQTGYTQVYNLEGSIFQWANEGRPLEREGKPTQQVHPYNAFWGRLLKVSKQQPYPVG